MLLELEHLQKKYGAFALDASLQVQEGCVTGLIGANGAGKTTAFKAVLGLIRADGGRAELFGKDIRTITPAEKAGIGVVLSDSGFCGYLDAEAIIRIMAKLYPRFEEKKFRESCERFSIPMDKKIKEFSTGMKAKFKVLTATSYQAGLLILDEPTAGLDVIARDEILSLLREYMEGEGRGILISSHISSDLEGLCDDIYMIDKGKIVLHEDTDVLLDSYGLIRAEEGSYEKLDRRYLLKKRKTAYGYDCLTGEKAFYLENYPGLVVEKGSIDEVITMMVKGEEI